MTLHDKIHMLRISAKLSQAQFADMLNVTTQAVQKWESGETAPKLDKLVHIAKIFGISLDDLVLSRDTRAMEELHARVQPNFENINTWEAYSAELLTEYKQSIDEGLNLERYAELFRAVSSLPKGQHKERLADILYDIVVHAKPRADYPYTEPSTIGEIRLLRNNPVSAKPFDRQTIRQKIHGAWMGRICGCLLGKTVEGIRTDELHPLLKDTDNYPMHRYIASTDISEERSKNSRFCFENRAYADLADGMPCDDDTNYTVMAQEIIERYGRDFSPQDVAQTWLALQPKNAYCTAERVAFRNFIFGYEPPDSAVFKNPYREWIGAQIRGDYYGYINPGDPETAAQMAFHDASISHVKNGIYGEMFIAATIAEAAVKNDIKECILGGLSQIPSTCRLYEAILRIVSNRENGTTQAECFRDIHARWNEHEAYDWCHTISNAEIVTAALLYGNGDFGRSVCMAVETGFDTDCNGATIGSILGMRGGIDSIPKTWTAPINDRLHTSIFGVGTVSVSERVDMTLKHIL